MSSDHDTPVPLSPDAGLALREPANRVSPRAVTYWRVTALVWDVVLCVALAVGWFFVPGRPWWATLLLVAFVVYAVAHVTAMPTIRYRVHRWEVTDEAIHTRSGWIGRETRIAPINRVQTVDFSQGAIMRAFGIAALTVTTASAAGPITITGLDAEETRELAARLTAITAADEGDAT
ncbi:MAG: PH domain-containing protein [Nocardioides sp.]|uniref:PH domain-containing protein n=1 Tax=Nocardioides sp. TaxID=35761 RepID=UPI003EFFBC7D